PGAVGSTFTWSVRTIPLNGSTSDGSTLAARKMSFTPFWVNVSLRLAVDVDASGNLASTQALALLDRGRSIDWRMRTSSPVGARGVHPTTDAAPHASTPWPALPAM